MKHKASIIYHTMKNSKAAAIKNDIAVFWIEVAIILNHFVSFKGPESPVNNISLDDLVGNNHETPFLVR